MLNNLCHKFGTPHSADLQKLQEICLDIQSSEPALQKFLLFIAFVAILFLCLVLFAKVITSDKRIINAYYKSAFTYFIQIFTVIAIVPVSIYIFGGEVDIVANLLITAGIFGLIFVMYEFWPVYKKEPEINNSIISTIFLIIFAIAYYKAFTMGIKDAQFIDTALVAVLMLYVMIINILVKLVGELKSKSE